MVGATLPSPLAPGMGDFLAGRAGAGAGSSAGGADSWCWPRGARPGSSQADAAGGVARGGWMGPCCPSAQCWQPALRPCAWHRLLTSETSCARSQGPIPVLAGTVARGGRAGGGAGGGLLSDRAPCRAVPSCAVPCHATLSCGSAGQSVSVRGTGASVRACEAGGNGAAGRGARARRGIRPCQWV